MSDFVIPFPVVVVDVGGTNARFALQPAPDAPLGEAVHLKTHDYPGLVEAAEAAVASLGAAAALDCSSAARGRSTGASSSSPMRHG